MLLRALENLNIGIKRGDLFPASRLKPKIRDILIVRGKVAPVNAPPIAVLSEFAAVSDVLIAAGIKTLSDVIEAAAVDGLTAEELATLKSNARAALTIPAGCGCRRSK